MVKTLLKVSCLFLTVASCLLAGPRSYGQEQEPWRNDWQKFGEAIAPYAREGAIERKAHFMEFNRIFSKEVEWGGTLRAFHANGVAKFLKLEMQPLRVPLRDGSTIEVKELSSSCADKESGCQDWSAQLIGKEVIFRTKLANRTRGYLPVVRLESMGEGEQRIEVETFGAKLIKVVSE